MNDVWIIPQEFNGLIVPLLPNQFNCMQYPWPVTTSSPYNVYNIHHKIDEWTACMGKTWREALDKEFKKTYFRELAAKVENERLRVFHSQTLTGSVMYSEVMVIPSLPEVFSWTQQCKIEEVKVVIVGQSPYKERGKDHGLAYSIKREYPSTECDLPQSLINIFSALEIDSVDFQQPNHSCLTGWAEQGVVLLNCILTVSENGVKHDSSNLTGCPGQGWEKFTDEVITQISTKAPKVVFMLWGEYAKAKEKFIDHDRHKVLTAPNPASGDNPSFQQCRHFSEANKFFGIDWNKL